MYFSVIAELKQNVLKNEERKWIQVVDVSVKSKLSVVAVIRNATTNPLLGRHGDLPSKNKLHNTVQAISGPADS